MGKKIIVSLLLLGFLFPGKIRGDDCANLDLSQKVICYERKLQQNQGQQKTLASTIAYLNNKTALTESQIKQTEADLKNLEEELTLLTVKISRLDENLSNIAKLLVSRVGASYKRSLFEPIFMLFSSDGLTGFFQKAKYLELAQQNDRNLLLELQTSKNQHEQQKQIKEEKQKQAELLRQKLAEQNVSLLQQKRSKESLLEITRNDEKTYQGLLDSARAEMAAIQSAVAGYGKEEKVGDINQGDRIASIIHGASACSTGTHLHLETADNNHTVNPANYLKPTDVDWDLCGWWPNCDGPFSFSGSWPWPVEGKPRITQGYGMTAYAKTGAYSGGPHTGLDMVSENLTVKAVQSGTLYRGSVACRGQSLQYVKVEHKNNSVASYYFHVNY